VGLPSALVVFRLVELLGNFQYLDDLVFRIWAPPNHRIRAGSSVPALAAGAESAEVTISPHSGLAGSCPVPAALSGAPGAEARIRN